MLDKIIQRIVPQWEDDSYFFSFEANNLPTDNWSDFFEGEDLHYLSTKDYMFENVVTDPSLLADFQRPSLRSINQIKEASA